MINSERGIFLQSMFSFSNLETHELSLSPSDAKWFLEVNYLGIWKNLELQFLGKGQKMITRNSEFPSKYSF